MTDHHRDEFEAYMRRLNVTVNLRRFASQPFGYKSKTVSNAWDLWDRAWQESRRTYRASEWQSIETAPRDGSAVLVMRDIWPGTASGRAEECNGHNTYVAEWWAQEGSNGEWVCYMDATADPICPVEPTHWMPLPKPLGCRGTACGTTTGEHSAECVAEHQGLFRDGEKP